MPIGYEIAVAVIVVVIAALAVLFSNVLPRRRVDREKKSAEPARVTSGEMKFVRPNAGTVEGLEIRYGADGLVRSVRVGAMNSEHKELLLTMDGVQWHKLPNAQKQEVVAAARSTWAEKMCSSGPDIAYLVVRTELGEIVARADPHSVTVL